MMFLKNFTIIEIIIRHYTVMVSEEKYHEQRKFYNSDQFRDDNVGSCL